MVILPLSALAEDLHAPHAGASSECAATWHFVHNQIPGAEQGVLTAQFKNAGTVSVSANKVLNSNQHYDVNLASADVLLGASDNIEGGKLVLSHVECVAPVETTTTTTEAPPETTTTTVVPETTTTVVIPETTTTTVLPPATTTTTVVETTTTVPVVPPTTTTELEELPETGADLALMSGLALVLMATGALLVRKFAKES